MSNTQSLSTDECTYEHTYELHIKLHGTEEQRQELRTFYEGKIAKMDSDKYLESAHKDSGFDLVVPWVKNSALENEGIYVYKPEQSKLCNLRVQIAAYKVRHINGSIPSMQPSPYYLYARSSIYKTRSYF